MRYLHTMVRVTNLDKSLHFYCEALGFTLVSKKDYPQDQFTLVFLRAPGDSDTDSPLLELTHNWKTARYERGDGYGHMAFAVESIDKIQATLKSHGYDLSWGPGKTPDGRTAMAFIDDPDGYELELLEKR